MAREEKRKMEQTVSARLPDELAEALNRVARKENPDGDLPISAFVRRAIKEYVEKRLGKGSTKARKQK